VPEGVGFADFRGDKYGKLVLSVVLASYLFLPFCVYLWSKMAV
jgi:hypothetical protein